VEAAEARRARVLTFADEFFPRYMEEMAVPGAVLVFVDGGQAVFTRAWGFADVEKNTPVVAEATAFRIASLGKTLTALAVLQLVERGVLDLDMPVANYTGEIGTLDDTVTLRRLLLHTAGFEDRLIGYQSRAGSDYPDLESHLRARLPRRFSALVDLPAYSNYGYALAGLAVERASQVSFREYVEREIFAPLEMDQTFFAVPPLDERANAIALEYTSTGEVRPMDFTNPYPASGVAVTASNMERFILAFLAAYSGQPNAIGAAARDMARTQGSLVPGLEGIGFGLNEQLIGGVRVWTKGGSSPKHHAVLLFLPDENSGVFIAINRQEPLFTQRLLAEFLPAFFPADPNTASPLPASDVEDFVGYYQLNRANFSGVESIASPLLQVRVVAANGDGLSLQPVIEGWAENLVFEPVGGNIFRTDSQYIAFAPPSQYGTMFINIDGDHFSLRSISWWERADVLAVTIGIALVLVLTFPVTRLLTFVVARARRQLFTFWAPACAGHVLAAAAVILAGASLFCIVQAEALIYGPTPALYGVSVASVLFVAATFWAGKTIIAHCREPVTLASRTHMILASLAALLIVAILIRFNIPLFRY